MIPFSLPDIGEREIAAVERVMKKGWISSGPEMEAFEQELAEYLGASNVVTLNSATAGLHLALIAAGVGPGDKVMIPTLTFAATAEVVKAVGAEIVLSDVDAGTLCITAKQMQAAWQDGIKAVIPVSFAGQPLYIAETCKLS